MKKIIFFIIGLLLTSSVNAATYYFYRYREHATDCTSITDGKNYDLCFEIDSNNLYKCDVSAGDCDTAGEWKLILSNLSANPSGCSAGQYVTDIDQDGTLTCAQPAFSQLSGTATDAQIPDTITIDNATTAATATAVSFINSSTATSGRMLIADGVAFNSVSLSGDATISDGGVVSVNNTKCTGSTEYLDGTGTCDDISSVYQAADADLDDLADGSLTGSKVGSGIDDDNVSFDDADSNFAATTIGAAIEELDDVNGSGPNAADGKVEWSQLVGVPSGFADGTDDGAGGGGGGTITIKDDTVEVLATTTPTFDFLLYADITESPTNEANIVIPNFMNPSVNSATASSGRLLIGDGVYFNSVSMGGDATITASGSVTVADDSHAHVITDIDAFTETQLETQLSDVSALFTNNVTGDVTVSGGTSTIGADKVTESMLKVVDSPADEECFTYESTTGDFEWQACGGGASSLTDLSDVNTATTTAGYVLIADGTTYSSKPISGCTLTAGGALSCSGSGATTLTDLADVSSATATSGRLLVANGTSYQSIAMAGDATINASGSIVIADDSVQYDDIDFINSATATRSRLLVADSSGWNSYTAYPGRLIISGDGVFSGVQPKGCHSSNPCSAANSQVIFFNCTGPIPCFCQGSSSIKLTDNTTSCF